MSEPEKRLRSELEKPYDARPRDNGYSYEEDEFNPWHLFPSVYGSYSSDFDECAIDVLSELKAKKKTRDDLGAEMFREILCTAGFCDYGTSPRFCFWVLGDHMLTDLLDRWKVFSTRKWGGEP